MNEERALTPREGGDLSRAGSAADLLAPAHTTSPVARVHRVLRGRYRWAILLGLALAIGGGFLGYTQARPLYRSSSIVYVSPTMPSEESAVGEAVYPLIDGFIAAQVAMIESPQTVYAAMENDDWVALKRGVNDEVRLAFQDSISVSRKRGTHHIVVSFSDPDPKAARIGVDSVVAAFLEIAKVRNVSELTNMVDRLEKDVLDLSRKEQSTTESIIAATEQWGGVEGLNLALASELERLRNLTAQIQQVDLRLKVLEESKEKESEAGIEIGNEPPERIALKNEQMAQLLLDLSKAKARLRTLERKGMGAQHPDVVAVKEEIQGFEDARDLLAKAYNAERMQQLLGKSPYDQLKDERAALETDRGLLNDEAMSLGRRQAEVGRLIANRKHTMERLETAKRNLARFEKVKDVGGRAKMLTKGNLPKRPATDKRKQLAVLFGAAGALVGVGIIFLLGHLDGRMRDTGDLRGWLGNRRVLGLVPDLSEGAKSPEDEDLALHCVQKIRTLVEIEFLPRDQRTLCVTGPNAGAGKSTLTLALGAALGAAGARTLLVDFDLTGRGLTRKVVGLLVKKLQSRFDPEPGGINGNGHASALMGILHGGSGGADRTTEIRELAARLLAEVDVTRRADQESVTDLVNLLNLGLDQDDLALLRSEHGDDLLTIGCVWDGERRMFRSTWTVPASPSDLEKETDLTPFLIETGIQNLTFLRVGQEGVTRTGEVSGAAVAAVLSAARENHDAILLDTGPVLGCLESSLVAAQADTVILTVLRGDQRQSAKKALEFLDEIGARLGGLVLNRATMRDARITSYTYSYGYGMSREREKSS